MNFRLLRKLSLPLKIETVRFTHPSGNSRRLITSSCAVQIAIGVLKRIRNNYYLKKQYSGEQRQRCKAQMYDTCLGKRSAR